jgi:hypothetical protein
MAGVDTLFPPFNERRAGMVLNIIRSPGEDGDVANFVVCRNTDYGLPQPSRFPTLCSASIIMTKGPASRPAGPVLALAVRRRSY